MSAQIIQLYPGQPKPGRSFGLAEIVYGDDGPMKYGRCHWCRHVVSGRIQAPKLCTRQEECYHCAFDQMLDEYERDACRDARPVVVNRRYQSA